MVIKCLPVKIRQGFEIPVFFETFFKKFIQGFGFENVLIHNIKFEVRKAKLCGKDNKNYRNGNYVRKC